MEKIGGEDFLIAIYTKQLMKTHLTFIYFFPGKKDVAIR
jgi:hypothetical protein